MLKSVSLADLTTTVAAAGRATLQSENSVASQPLRESVQGAKTPEHERARLTQLFSGTALRADAISRMARWTIGSRYFNSRSAQRVLETELSRALHWDMRGSFAKVFSDYVSAVLLDTPNDDKGLRHALAWLRLLFLFPPPSLEDFVQQAQTRWEKAQSEWDEKLAHIPPEHRQHLPLHRIEAEHLKLRMRTAILTALSESPVVPLIFGELASPLGRILLAEWEKSGFVDYVAIAAASGSEKLCGPLSRLLDQIYASRQAGRDMRYDELQYFGLVQNLVRAWSQDYSESFEFCEASITENDFLNVMARRLSNCLKGSVQHDDRADTLVSFRVDAERAWKLVDRVGKGESIDISISELRLMFKDLFLRFDALKKDLASAYGQAFLGIGKEIDLVEKGFERLDRIRLGCVSPLSWRGTFRVSGQANDIVRCGDEPTPECLSVSRLSAYGGELYIRARHGRFKTAVMECAGHIRAHAHLALGSNPDYPLLIGPIHQELGFLGLVALTKSLLRYAECELGLTEDQIVFSGEVGKIWRKVPLPGDFHLYYESESTAKKPL